MDILAVIAERKIREAMERGEFDNLPGRGKPLVLVDELSGLPAELRMAYRLLRNAGFLSPEVEDRKENVTLRDLEISTEEDGESARKRKEMEYKLLKLSTIRKRPMKLNAWPEYSEKIAGKLERPREEHRPVKKQGR